MPTLYDRLWGAVMDAKDGVTLPLDAFMTLFSAVQRLVFTNTLHNILALYDLLSASYTSLFEQTRERLALHPTPNPLESFLALLSSFDSMRALQSKLFLSVDQEIPALRLRTFPTFPTVDDLFLYHLRTHLFLPLLPSFLPTVIDSIGAFLTTSSLPPTLSAIFAFFWQAALSDSHRAPQHVLDASIAEFTSLIAQAAPLAPTVYPAVSHLVHATTSRASHLTILKAICPVFFPNEVLADATALCVDNVLTSPQTTESLLEGLSVVGAGVQARHHLRMRLAADLKANEAVFVAHFAVLRRTIARAYPHTPEILQELLNAANSCLCNGVGTAAYARYVMRHPQDDVCAELYALCDLKDALHAELLTVLASHLAAGRPAPQAFIDHIGASAPVFVFTCNRMVADAADSRRVCARFGMARQTAALAARCSVNVLVASAHVWPFAKAPLPCFDELAPLLVAFTGFYHVEFPKRRVRYLHNLSVYEVSVWDAPGRLVAGHTPLCVLSALAARTGRPATISQAMYDEVCRLLRAHGVVDDAGTPQPLEADVDLSRVRISTPQPKEEEQRTSRLALQAAVVRVAKQTGRFVRDELPLLLDKLGLTASLPVLQPLLDDLVGLEYLAFDRSTGVYTYVP